MVVITANVDRKDVVFHCSTGEPVPRINGRLRSIEISGRDLTRFAEAIDMPIMNDTSSVSWFGKHAGRTLRILQELSEKRDGSNTPEV